MHCTCVCGGGGAENIEDVAVFNVPPHNLNGHNYNGEGLEPRLDVSNSSGTLNQGTLNTSMNRTHWADYNSYIYTAKLHNSTTII